MTIEQIRKKLEVGDYILASKMLKITPENARIRFARNKEDVKSVILLIINNREKLIENFHKSLNSKN
ncbi:hypothetical protein ETU08_00735 [Apibacter muscae]|uniref:hypothetical protein n=1 Tax=Apibacter muscae TaxID=2509004 RepID=UPI0011AD4FFB|nr:hypothetical protein [Apibacter muscae]TWP31557.1 hypothetical protein ETU08_00735 [Apibacter muscae]